MLADTTYMTDHTGADTEYMLNTVGCHGNCMGLRTFL